MTDAAIPPGFAPLFAGWNVWSVWQKNDLDFELGGVGLDAERRLRVWVEDMADAASGAQLHDPLNPSAKHFDGDEVDVLQNAAGLAPAVDRTSVPVGIPPLEGAVTLRYVRFFNRGVATVLPWPHSSNYLLEAVYAPAKDNPVTNAPAPVSATETVKDGAKAAASGLGSLATVAAWGVGALVVLKVVELARGK